MTAPAVIDLKECTLFLVDGTTPTANELEFKFDEGNLTYSIKRNIEYRKDRGLLDETREGDEEPMDVSFDGRFSAVTSYSGEDVTAQEFLQQIGAASAYESTGGACQPYAIDLRLEIDRDCDGVVDEIITFTEFRFEEIGGDFKAGTISVTGKCNVVRPSSVRTTVA